MALIEREALKRRLENYSRDCEEAGDMVSAQVFADCICELDASPSIDAAPVVHGRWIWSPEYCKWICSACGGREGECETPICKWCGARMDGGEAHEAD